MNFGMKADTFKTKATLGGFTAHNNRCKFGIVIFAAKKRFMVDMRTWALQKSCWGGEMPKL